MKTSPLVSVIIVNWNGLHWLADCFSTLSKVIYKNTEWILVDNASKDGSTEWVNKHYPKTKVIKNKENLGFSHANNLGYKSAKGKYILFLNNDTQVRPDFIAELLTVFTDPEVGGAQSKILLMDDHTRLDSIGAFLTPTGFLYHNHLGDKDRPEYDRGIDLYTVKGACMMFRADVLKKTEVNGLVFDPSYFAYFEETDLCHRIWLNGYRNVYAPRSVIFHKMGATSSKLVSAWVQYHSYKNRIHSYLKNLDVFHLWTILPVHLLLCQLLAAVFLLKGSRDWALAIEKAIWWNMVNIRNSLKSRRYVQSVIRKRSDSAFFPIIMKYPNPVHYLRFLGEFLRIYRP